MLNGLSRYVSVPLTALIAALSFAQLTSFRSASAATLTENSIPQPIVRVRLKVDAKNLKVSGAHIEELSDLTDSALQIGLPQRQSVSVNWNNGNPIWSVTNKGEKSKARTLVGSQLKLRPFGLNTLIHINALLVPKTTYLIARPKNQIDVVAELPLEEYLLGVLPSEMPLVWHEEALKAQSVAARSYTLSVMSDRKNSHFHVESTIFDQVYSLKNQLSARRPLRKKLKEVLSETAGQYLSLEDGQVYRTFYHADSGGATESSQFVEGFAYKKQPSFSVKSPHASGPHGLWKRFLPKQSLERTLKSYFKSKDSLKSIDIVSRSDSGRIKDLKVTLGESEYTLSGQEFRKIVGFVKIKSTNFEIEDKGSLYVINGRGFGHGVGMCQWGARFLANRGLKYREILSHYYPQTQIKPVSYASASNR